MVKNIRLITTPDNCKTIKTVDSEDGSNILDSFFLNSDNFGDRKNYFALFMGKQIRLYDKKMKPIYSMKGLKIRGCINAD